MPEISRMRVLLRCGGVFRIMLYGCLVYGYLGCGVLHAQIGHSPPEAALALRASAWADSLLRRLSPKAQLAQLLLVPLREGGAYAPTKSMKKHPVGGFFVYNRDTIPEPPQTKIPPKIPYWTGRAFFLNMPLDSPRLCLGETLIAAMQDQAFLRRSAQEDTWRLQRQGMHFFISPVPCAQQASHGNLAYYYDAMQSTGMAYLAALQEDAATFSLGDTLSLLLSTTPSKTLDILYKRLRNKSLDKDSLRKACQRVLEAKYKSMHAATPVAPQLSASFQERQFFEKALTVLHNKDNLLPLQELETLRAAILSLGEGADTPFARRVQDYLEMPFYTLSGANACAQLEEVDVVLLALYDPLETLAHLSAEAWACLLHALAHKRVILCLFGRAEVLNTYPVLKNTAAMVHAYSPHRHAQDYTAQLLFGGIAAQGRLPYPLTGYEKGSGQTLCCPSRLKFTVPEEVGIHADTLGARIAAIIHEGMAQQAFPGCQILLAKDGKVFFYEAYGFHTYQQERALRRSDLYDLASITKVMGPTTALMRMYEQGRFVPDVALSEYIPLMRRSNKASLAFRQVLAHHAGIQAWIPYYKTVYKRNGKYRRRTLSKQRSKRYPTALSKNLFLHRGYKKNIYKMIKKSPLHEAHGYVYSDLLFYLLPEFIEDQSGQPYVRYLYDMFYRPLGAQTLVFNADKHFELERIVPTEIDTFFRMRVLHGVVHDEGAAMMGGVSGHAGLFGKAVDVAKMWQMYLQGGSYGQVSFLQKETLEHFTSCQFCEEGNRRGLGFDRPNIVYQPQKSHVAPQASQESFGHSGFTGTFVWADPKHQLLYVFLSNRVHPTRDHSAIYTLDIRPRIHEIVYELLEKE